MIDRWADKKRKKEKKKGGGGGAIAPLYITLNPVINKAKQTWSI